MQYLKIGLLSILAIVVLLIITFGFGLFGLEYKKFFAPKHENVNRQVFEQTQSYVHGKVQDLAKYYEEYNKAEAAEDKEAIRSLILMRFAEFDATKIRSQQLQNFLTTTRGY